MPPKEIRELRDLTRYRKTQIQERTRETQRLDKILQDAGIKLSSVASRVLGVSGRAMLDALVKGTTDPEVHGLLYPTRKDARQIGLDGCVGGRQARGVASEGEVRAPWPKIGAQLPLRPGLILVSPGPTARA